MRALKLTAIMVVVVVATLGIVANNDTAQQKLYVWHLGLPNGLFENLLDNPTIEIEGQSLHPKLQYLLELHGDPEEEPFEYYLENPEAMAYLRKMVDIYWPLRAKSTAAMAKVEDRLVPDGDNGEMRLRIYTPDSAANQSEPVPIMVYFHGGAFLMGSIEALDPAARLIANRLGAVVVSVNYRLAPEHPFPAAHKDAAAAYQWVREHAEELGGSPEKLLVGGDSAGGNLALSVSHQQIIDGQSKPLLQLLFYPSTDVSMDYPSYDLYKNGFGLDEDVIEAALAAYVADASLEEQQEANPIDYHTLNAMPPTVVATAGFDPIRDQGSQLADRLNGYGVKVTHLHYPSLIHNFLEYTGVVDDAERATEESIDQIRQWLNTLPNS